ncbi:unnamed protein product [Rodentolepis nana]|uniref:Peptidase S1 domain-containing protein n=1 Tax=Rodentolepis nana TaxID=102285 RepID=A0A0R3TMK4_RODNA|nr:unnamed protein product [Rodentolepis nana]
MCNPIFWVLVLAAWVSRADSPTKTTDETDAPLGRFRRIIGGDYVEQSEFPYMVSIQAKLKKDIFATLTGGVQHFCGGTLIDSQWIVTAAHCIYAYDKNNTRVPLVDPKIWHVRMGTKELQAFFSLIIIIKPTLMDRLKGALTRLFNYIYGQRKLQTYYHVEKIILHPKYKEPKLEYDIALMKLKERIQLHHLRHLDILRLPFPAIVGYYYPPEKTVTSPLI